MLHISSVLSMKRLFSQAQFCESAAMCCQRACRSFASRVVHRAPQQLQALQTTPLQQQCQGRVVLMALQVGPRKVLHWAAVVPLLVVEQHPLATRYVVVRGSFLHVSIHMHVYEVCTMSCAR